MHIFWPLLTACASCTQVTRSSNTCSYRNILKTNDVRTGLKKPEEDSKKRAASVETAQLADATQTVDVAASDGQLGASSSSAAAAAAPTEWDIARAARERWVLQPLIPEHQSTLFVHGEHQSTLFVHGERLWAKHAACTCICLFGHLVVCLVICLVARSCFRSFI